MDLKKAIEILEYYQQWRLGITDEIDCTSKTLTEAMDLVLKTVKAQPANKCQCKRSKFTRMVDADFNCLCGKCGEKV